MRRLQPSSLVILLVLAVNILIALQGLWPGPKDGLANTVVRSDVKGYYGYLQAIFIRKDLGHEANVWEYVRHTPTGTLNKYYCGTAIMLGPWFLIGHDIALSDPKAPRDGLSVHEMRAISIGAWVYLLLGLAALRGVLRGLGFCEVAVAWTLLAIGLGTQLLQYSALQPGWSHIHSFFAISLFLLCVQRFATGKSPWWMLASSALLGLIILIRPVNALVVLALPVLLGAGTVGMLKRLISHRLMLMLSIALFAAILFIQPLLWHAQTGQWYAYGYSGEGFHWSSPEMLKVLFGFRRGLFLWAPVLLLVLLGTALLLKRDRVRGLGMVLYLVINTYVISAWWIWYYGSGFGSRPFVDHYPVLAIPLAFFLNELHGWRRRATQGFIAMCCALLLFQMWQFHVHILHHESMDRAKYAHVFLRWGDAYKGSLGGNFQAPPFSPNGMSVVLEEICDFEHRCAHWHGGGIRSRTDAFSGGNAVVFDGSDEYGISFEAGTDVLPAGRALYMEVGIQRREERSRDAHHLLGVTEVRLSDGSIDYYEPFAFNPVPAEPGAWEQVEYRIPVPPLAQGGTLKFYFWDKDRRSRVLIDDVFMRVSAVNPY
ncbi:MAG: hypothetical protein IPJ85_04300 [Flavobacteriales bacterium]|nr:hypothetical protein [Flavobacteriales bacterium]